MVPFHDLLFCHSLYALSYVPIHAINLHLVEIFAHISDFSKIYFKLSPLTPKSLDCGVAGHTRQRIMGQRG